MPSSLFNQPNPMNNIQQIKSMMNMVKTSNNPNAFIQNLLSKNPQVKQLMDLSNGNAKDAFYKLAQQRGINPYDVINQLK